MSDMLHELLRDYIQLENFSIGLNEYIKSLKLDIEIEKGFIEELKLIKMDRQMERDIKKLRF